MQRALPVFQPAAPNEQQGTLNEQQPAVLPVQKERRVVVNRKREERREANRRKVKQESADDCLVDRRQRAPPELNSFLHGFPFALPAPPSDIAFDENG